MDELISTLNKELIEQSCSVKLVAKTPKPIIYFEVVNPDRISREIRDKLLNNLVTQAMRLDSINLIFRGISLNRLEHVLSHGCDVEPTDSVIYADFLDKALEYGNTHRIGVPKGKAVLIFSTSRMKRCFLEVSSSIKESALDELKKEYPTSLTSIDGTKIWLSRLPEEHPNLASADEKAYGWYIPGDALEALNGILVFGSGPEIESQLMRSIEACTAIQWC